LYHDKYQLYILDQRERSTLLTKSGYTGKCYLKPKYFMS